MTRSPDRLTIENARIVTPSRLIGRGYLAVDGPDIVELDEGSPPRPTGTVIDADGQLLCPGFIDLHGDDFERYLFPRSEARIDPGRALIDCDRGNLAAGITTKFHAVAFEDDPDENRSVALAEEFVDAVPSTGALGARHGVHLRCEIGDPGYATALDLLDRACVGICSIMNHLPGEGQFSDAEQFVRRYGGDGRDRALKRTVRRRRRLPGATLGERVDRIARAARDADLPLASHDDERPGHVREMYDRGAAISEFPVTLAAAKRASELGMVTAMGAPNLVRGGSLWGNLSTRAAIEAGILDVLCTDYHPSSLLDAVFVDTNEPIADRVARATSGPADAVGLDRRGRLQPGMRADLILVDGPPRPTVRRVFVDGTEVYRAV